MERISKALADQTRLNIYEVIARSNGMTCGDVVALHGVTPATISHHLKILADARLIACRKQGQFVHNQALPETLTAYTAALTRLAATRKGARRRK